MPPLAPPLALPLVASDQFFPLGYYYWFFFFLQFFAPCRFMVDGIPIKVYRNHADKGVQYPQWKPMNLVASIWNGEGWATRGGKDKIDWSKAPFIASFRNYKVDACFWRGNAGFCRANRPSNWWNNPRFSQLNPRQRKMLVWVRKYYMYYDYCTDRKRFPSLPKECTIAL